jgi:hypothetical protein
VWQLNEIVAITYLRGYAYRITFDDGLEGDIDFSEFLEGGPVFQPLRALNFFRRARVEGGTIAWPNGADIAPEVLYEKAEDACRPARADAPCG